MTMERDFWIPNLSGEVSGKERLQAYIKEYSSDEFALCLNKNVVTMRLKSSPSPALIDFKLEITIPANDSKGMCHLKCNFDVTALNIYIANKAWKEFRSTLDGCYGAVYNCTGMDEPFNKFHEKQRRNLHKTCNDDCCDIVNRFIQSVEQSSDTMNYLWKELKTVDNKNHEKIAHESLAKAESNKLYFNSFIDLYSDRFESDWLKNKKKEMDLRIDKAKIAYSTIYKERRNEYERATIRIALIALSLSFIATVANILIGLISLI